MPEAQKTGSAALLKQHLGEAPSVAVVLGSGAGGLAAGLADVRSVGYGDVGFPPSGVVGHAGTAHVGTLCGVRVCVMAGRKHLYEGDDPRLIAKTVRALYDWGVRDLILTSAVGSLRAQVGPGSLVAITDHINLTGRNPLVGDDGSRGTAFIDMAQPYDASLLEAADNAATAANIALHKGVYAAMLGPSYETAAEVRMLAMLGADVVGMSVVPEVISARHLGMRVLAISIISNFATGIGDEALSHDEVTEVVGAAAGSLETVITRVLEWL